MAHYIRYCLLPLQSVELDAWSDVPALVHVTRIRVSSQQGTYVYVLLVSMTRPSPVHMPLGTHVYPDGSMSQCRQALQQSRCALKGVQI